MPAGRKKNAVCMFMALKFLGKRLGHVILTGLHRSRGLTRPMAQRGCIIMK